MGELKKVLIIEDEPNFLKIYADLLGNKGYKVSTATEGEQGLKKIYEEMPNLILLDLVLPGKTGMEIIQIIKNDDQTKAIPVVVFSVLDTTDKIQQAIGLGANDYLIKGVAKPTEILYKIETLLGDNRGPLEKRSFRLKIGELGREALEMSNFLGVGNSLKCPKCHTVLEIELLPDNTRDEGHWFAAHFSCPQCKQDY